MPYKKSRFNFTYRQSEDAYVVFNTYSKALVVLSSAEFEQFNAQHFDDSQMVRELADNGILVDETFDEIGFMTYCHNMTKFSKGSLHLVLATTMDCNFACPYCYENRRKGKMSIAVQDAIVQFIEANINNGVHKLDVTWYGGEPLLYPDIVESLAARIRSLADRSGCELTMYMVTNGYLFTPDLVELIDRIGVVKVQITLDGLKEHHDSRRHLRDGRGTFDKIIENLRLFEEYAIRVDIRMNVDNENCRDYIGLQQKLAELDNPNVVLYPSPVEDINPDTENEVSDFMTFDEFEKFAGDICKEGDATSAATKVLDDRYCYCQAETENSYVIDELGNCYKCWDQVGRVETCCFNITSPDKKNYSNIAVDDRAESCRMAEYLLGLGHKQIALITENAEGESVGKLRLLGYQDALKEQGIAVNPKLILKITDDVDPYSMENGYRMTKELLQSGEPFTAVYAIADTLAIGACRALHEAGKRIPEDVSVAGFDGIPLGEYYIPKLSTMRQPVEAMADKTVRLLLQILEEGGSHEHLIFPAELVIRESTAPPG